MNILHKLPSIRGTYREHASLSKTTWFNVGGEAEILFRPEDEADLCHFIKNVPKDISYMAIGVGSNLLVRDGGIDGVVIRLGRAFTNVKIDGEFLTAGAGTLNYNLVAHAKNHLLSGAEFMIGIPGSVGGGIIMNSECYGDEIASILISATLVDDQGNIHIVDKKDLGLIYRGSNIPKGWIITEAKFKLHTADLESIENKIKKITDKRTNSQPIKERTGGSTFKNPPGHRAWELIENVGMRGYKIGGAIVSDKHCNFLINTGSALAKDLEDLGELIIKKVFENSGIKLEWEIKIIGKAL